MCNQMQSFLITNHLLLLVTPRKSLIATQDNRISDEEQQAASVRFFETQLPQAKRAQITPAVTHTNNLQQQTLFNIW